MCHVKDKASFPVLRLFKKVPFLVWCVRSLEKAGHVCQNSFDGLPVLTYWRERVCVWMYSMCLRAWALPRIIVHSCLFASLINT